MNRICIGITQITPGWKSLLDQLGLWYEKVDFNRSLTRHYSAIIVSDSLSHTHHKKLSAYMHHGGAVLAAKSVKNFRSLKKSTLTFTGTTSYEYSNEVNFFATGDGFLIQLAFNPDNAFADWRYSRKRFYFKTGKHPDELVSSVNKEGLATTIDSCLKELHIRRGLPYIQKWHSPDKQPVFAFRIDSDYGDQKSMQRLYALAREYAIPMTWFLHVEAHEDWLSLFHEFKDQEIALHGYEHGTSTSYKHVIANIERGKQLLLEAGFTPMGYCAPYGIWNKALAEALQQNEFEYTSEFTLAYDALPFQPVYKNELMSPIQIPIHPICTGSLNRKRASVKEMEQYFLSVLAHKTKAFENTLFYHHPLQPGLSLWNTVFKRVNELGLTKMSFYDYARFWKKRNQAVFESYFNKKNMELKGVSSDDDLLIKISFDQNSFHLLPAKKTNAHLNPLEKISHQVEPTLTDAELDELSGEPLNLLKTTLLDWKNRKRL